MTLLICGVVIVGALIVWVVLDKPPDRNGAGPWDYEDDEEEV